MTSIGAVNMLYNVFNIMMAVRGDLLLCALPRAPQHTIHRGVSMGRPPPHATAIGVRRPLGKDETLVRQKQVDAHEVLLGGQVG